MRTLEEEKPIAYVLLVSDLKETAYAQRLKRLVGNLPKALYLAHTHPFIPPLYYSIPSVAWACERARVQAHEELAFFAEQLTVPSSHTFLLTTPFTACSEEGQLQRRLVRRLKRPVRLLTLSQQEAWLYALGLGLPMQAGDSGKTSKKAVNRRLLTHGALF